jgi:hypothetical protein
MAVKYGQRPSSPAGSNDAHASLTLSPSSYQLADSRSTQPLSKMHAYLLQTLLVMAGATFSAIPWGKWYETVFSSPKEPIFPTSDWDGKTSIPFSPERPPRFLVNVNSG